MYKLYQLDRNFHRSSPPLASMKRVYVFAAMNIHTGRFMYVYRFIDVEYQDGEGLFFYRSVSREMTTEGRGIHPRGTENEQRRKPPVLARKFAMKMVPGTQVEQFIVPFRAFAIKTRQRICINFNIVSRAGCVYTR